MNDEQVEQALRRYQPRGPDPSLRARSVAATPRRVPLRPVDWALLAAAASLAIAAAWPQPRPDDASDPVATAYRQQLEDAAAMLGGDPQARQLALMVVSAGQANAQENEP